MLKLKVFGAVVSLALVSLYSTHAAQLGEHGTNGTDGGGNPGNHVNNSGRRTTPIDGGPRRNPIGEVAPIIAPPAPAPQPNRAPAVTPDNAYVIGDAEGFLGPLNETLQRQLNPVPPQVREEAGIGSAAEHAFAKYVDGVGVVIQLGNWIVGSEFARNAQAAQDAYRASLNRGETKYLLIAHQGAGQVRSLPVKSPDDKPWGWNPDQMVIVPVTRFSVDGQQLYDATHKLLQAKFDELEAARLRPKPGPPVIITPSIPPAPAPVPPTPRCSGRHCVHNPR